MKQKIKKMYSGIYSRIKKENEPLVTDLESVKKEQQNKKKKLEILESNIANNTIKPVINYTPFKCKEVLFDGDIKIYMRPPENYPKDLNIKPLTGLGNDYSFLESEFQYSDTIPVSIVVLTYNRAVPLSKTLSGILNQNYPLDLIEVIVSDDGGTDDNLSIIKEFSKKLDIKYSWHRDVGFTPAAARNNGVGIARNDFIILLDVDMYPDQNLVKEYVNYHNVLDRAVLIGPRKYIDLNDIEYEELLNNPVLVEEQPEVITNNTVAGKIKEKKSVDWRLEIFGKTDFLKNEKVPFRVFASGNVAFSKNRFNLVGGFDEVFNNWGHEDIELGFRFFNSGLYVIPVMSAWAYHQEPENYINETDRSSGHSISKEYFSEMCPYYRHLSSTPQKAKFTIPKVSIYIPAYNAETTIIDAVESVLNQTFTDIEVCICDDGSTDQTLKLIEKYYINDNRVRWVSQKNAGIAAASNAAVKLCRGIYVGQLDSDDYLAEDVVEKCFVHLDKDTKLGLVYTTNENEYNNGNIIQGYNYPVFTREKMLTVSLVHHFRLFKKLYWCRTDGFNERIKNAVDYDMFLKLTEVCEVKHLNIIGYRRRLHGNNTSILDSKEQIKNTAKVVNSHLERMESEFRCELVDENLTTLVYIKNGIHVEVKENKDSVSFIVCLESDDKKIAFYLYDADNHIDTQWYSKNMSYVVDKKMRGKGEYGVRYFIVDENDEDPGNSNNKQVGISKKIVVN